MSAPMLLTAAMDETSSATAAPIPSESPRPARAAWPWVVFAAIAIVAVAARLWLATLGHNYDMQCWEIASDLVVSGQNVYANTPPTRYNYGPAWFGLLGGLKWFVKAIHATHPEAFHVAVAAALSVADVTIGWLLWRRLNSLVAAAVFLLNPVSALITGYHTQADTLAIAYAFGAWALLRPGREIDTGARQPPYLRVLGAAALMAMSLLTKHLMVLFPIWVLMSSRTLSSRGKRLLFVAATFAITVAGFVPFSLSAGAWDGIKTNVLKYQSYPNTNALLVRAIDLFVPYQYVDRWLRHVPGVNGIRGIFMGAMLVVGWVVARKRPGLLFYYYLLALVVLTSAMADQYMVIPVAACALFWRRWPAWVYTIAATVLLMFSPVDVGRQVFRWWYGPKEGTKLFREMATLPVDYYRATIWLVVLLLWEWWPTLWRQAIRPVLPTISPRDRATVAPGEPSSAPSLAASSERSGTA